MRVDPIRTMKDVNAIRKLLNDKPRDLLLFNLGVGSGIRCGDLLKLKIADIMDRNLYDKITIVEGKTKKINYILINKNIFKSINIYLESLQNIDPEYYVFKSRKGRNYPISIYYVGLLVKKWTSMINLKGNFGAHSLRKTWATIQRLVYNVDISLVQKRLNHNSSSVTKAYIGIIDSEIEDILKHEI